MRPKFFSLTKFSNFRSKIEAIELFRKNGFIESEETDDGEVRLKQYHFKFDKLCPLFVSCIPMDRSQFAKSVLMKDNQFIMQVGNLAWLYSKFYMNSLE